MYVLIKNATPNMQQIKKNNNAQNNIIIQAL